MAVNGVGMGVAGPADAAQTIEEDPSLDEELRSADGGQTIEGEPSVDGVTPQNQTTHYGDDGFDDAVGDAYSDAGRAIGGALWGEGEEAELSGALSDAYGRSIEVTHQPNALPGGQDSYDVTVNDRVWEEELPYIRDSAKQLLPQDAQVNLIAPHVASDDDVMRESMVGSSEEAARLEAERAAVVERLRRDRPEE